MLDSQDTHTAPSTQLIYNEWLALIASCAISPSPTDSVDAIDDVVWPPQQTPTGSFGSIAPNTYSGFESNAPFTTGPSPDGSILGLSNFLKTTGREPQGQPVQVLATHPPGLPALGSGCSAAPAPTPLDTTQPIYRLPLLAQMEAAGSSSLLTLAYHAYRIPLTQSGPALAPPQCPPLDPLTMMGGDWLRHTCPANSTPPFSLGTPPNLFPGGYGYNPYSQTPQLAVPVLVPTSRPLPGAFPSEDPLPILGLSDPYSQDPAWFRPALDSNPWTSPLDPPLDLSIHTLETGTTPNPSERAERDEDSPAASLDTDASRPKPKRRKKTRPGPKICSLCGTTQKRGDNIKKHQETQRCRKAAKREASFKPSN